MHLKNKTLLTLGMAFFMLVCLNSCQHNASIRIETQTSDGKVGKGFVTSGVAYLLTHDSTQYGMTFSYNEDKTITATLLKTEVTYDSLKDAYILKPKEVEKSTIASKAKHTFTDNDFSVTIDVTDVVMPRVASIKDGVCLDDDGKPDANTCCSGGGPLHGGCCGGQGCGGIPDEFACGCKSLPPNVPPTKYQPEEPKKGINYYDFFESKKAVILLRK